MARTTEDARRWVAHGTALLGARLKGLDDQAVRADSTLPGWSVGQLIAHVAANAEALGNLVRWAATGVETPMYASVEARDAAIAVARTQGAEGLLAAFRASARTLDAGFDELDRAAQTAQTGEKPWHAEVRTIQGRVLPATEIPWLRAREVCVHAVDLGASFGDLPDDFLDALIDDIRLKRGLTDADLPTGPRAEVAAWLAGRPHTLTDAPEIGAWL